MKIGGLVKRGLKTNKQKCQRHKSNATNHTSQIITSRNKELLTQRQASKE